MKLKVQPNKQTEVFGEVVKKFYTAFGNNDAVQAAFYYKTMRGMAQQTSNRKFNNRLQLINFTIKQSGSEGQIAQLQQVHDIIKAGLV